MPALTMEQRLANLERGLSEVREEFRLQQLQFEQFTVEEKIFRVSTRAAHETILENIAALMHWFRPGELLKRFHDLGSRIEKLERSVGG